MPLARLCRLPFWGALLWFAWIQAASAWASLPPPSEVAGRDALTGQAVALRLAEAKKASVIAFVSARCPCSMSHEGALRDLAREFPPPSFQFVAVNSNADETAEFAKAHFQSSAFPFPIIRDERSQIANAWGALKTPHVFVVSPQGEVLYQGGVDDSHVQSAAAKPFLRNALVAIQANQKPENPRTRTLGCAIKR